MSEYPGYPVKPENVMITADAILSSRFPQSKAEIAELTRLSVMTVGKVTDELYKTGLIEMSKDESTEAGRKAVLLSPNPEVLIAAAEISEGYITLSLYNLIPELQKKETVKADTKNSRAIFAALNSLCGEMNAKPACCVITAKTLSPTPKPDGCHRRRPRRAATLGTDLGRCEPTYYLLRTNERRSNVGQMISTARYSTQILILINTAVWLAGESCKNTAIFPSWGFRRRITKRFPLSYRRRRGFVLPIL